jgi:hypothetical protein
LITIAWVASHIRLARRLRGWLLGMFAAACVVEVSLITVQAWRRVPSHFNMETALDGAIARVLAGGGGVLVMVIVVLTVASWRADSRVAPSMRLAVRAGLLALDVALLIGVLMIVAGVGRVLGGDQQAAYAVGGSWKPAHAVTMHGVLVLPLLAALLARAAPDERHRVRIVWLAVVGYAVLCGVVVAETVAGINPLHAPPVLTGLGGMGALAVAAAVLLTVTPLARPGSSGRPVWQRPRAERGPVPPA